MSLVTTAPQESLLLSNLEQFAEEYAAVDPNSQPGIIRNAASATRDAEMLKRGAAWMDSYDILIEKLRGNPNHEDFTKKLRQERTYLRALRCQFRGANSLDTLLVPFALNV